MVSGSPPAGFTQTGLVCVERHTPDRYPDARIIFIDTQESNWTWDEVAGAYYWHRFYAHQPDLNFDNPEVREAVKEIVRFWLDLGFDGLRLDAIPYLFEREGTNCENLPETHAFLKELRAMIDDEYQDRMMIAESNQPPIEVVAYLGDGDECHMAYHFPIMPTLYMALKRQVVTDIVDALATTPPIPANCAWGVFLRNHDELTLEMVTEADRQFMYEQYAPDPAMRKNVGIRRRLAPLLDNERARIELLHGILLSLPGSPFLYYGDEIGMGDEYLLNDRDGVRTPMQWSPEAGGGFSSAGPESFYLPLVSDPAYSVDRINVSDQRADDASLLHFVRHLLALRRENPILGTGDFATLDVDNPAVLAYRRGADEESILVFGNFATTVQEVDLAEPGAEDSVDLISGKRSGPQLELAPHEFVWLARRF